MNDEPDRSPRSSQRLPDLPGKAVGSVDALAAFNNLVEGGREYFRLREEHRTTRAQIEAWDCRAGR